MSLQTQMQNAADALALAGADELNRAPGSRDRATKAINDAKNRLVFNGLAGMGSSNVQVKSIVFYQDLPPASQPISNGTVAPDDGHARFVAVTLEPVKIFSIFPVSFIESGAADNISAGAVAVAGMDEVACKYTPMFICNPWETSGLTYDQATTALLNASKGELVALQAAGNGQYGPGNYGWVQAPVDVKASGTCGTASQMAQEIAQSTPFVCFDNTSINTETGNLGGSANNAINTRFDLYGGAFNKCNGNSLYKPAQNVRKGYLQTNKGKSGACSQAAQDPYPSGNIYAMGFPLDSNMLNADGTPNTSSTAPLLGNSDWPCGDVSTDTTATAPPTVACTTNCKNNPTTLTVDSTAGIYAGMGITVNGSPTGAYVASIDPTAGTIQTSEGLAIAVGPSTPVTLVGYWNSAHPVGTSGHSNPPSGCFTSPVGISRQDVAQYEIDNGYVNDLSSGDPSTGIQESGAPACYTKNDADESRRDLNVAVLNCKALEAAGYTLNGSSKGLPVAAFAKFFMTQPVETSQGAIYGEFSGISTPGNSSSLYYQVQLYR